MTGFLDFAQSLRSINVHEFSSVPELTRKPTLRKESHSRDPRNGRHVQRGEDLAAALDDVHDPRGAVRVRVRAARLGDVEVLRSHLALAFSGA